MADELGGDQVAAQHARRTLQCAATWVRWGQWPNSLCTRPPTGAGSLYPGECCNCSSASHYPVLDCLPRFPGASHEATQRAPSSWGRGVAAGGNSGGGWG